MYQAGKRKKNEGDKSGSLFGIFFLYRGCCIAVQSEIVFGFTEGATANLRVGVAGPHGDRGHGDREHFAQVHQNTFENETN